MAGRAIKQFSGGGGGQSLNDRMTSAKHIITGSGLGRAVCKATTEELIAPKKKHLGYLIECTNQSNVSIPELANALLERLANSNWVVVFKALVSIHSMMNYGNERFTQYLASNNCNLSLRNFYDKSSVQGADMSRFICRYSAYVQEKAFAYRSLAFDLCKVKRGSDDGVLRTLSVERLLRALPVLTGQFDALLSFDATPTELSNAVIHAAFLIMYKDASRLFVVFNDGIINLLSSFFESMSRKQCREALDVYKKFLIRSERLAEFSRVAESAGIDRADVAQLERHPTSFLEAMEGHLAQLEGRRVSRSDSNNSLGSVGASATSAASAVAAPAAAAASASGSGQAVSETQRQALLMEEQRQLDRLKAERERQQQKQQPTAAQAAKPASLPPPSQQPPQPPQPPPPQQPPTRSEEDFLLMLDPVPSSAKLPTAIFSPFPPQQTAISQSVTFAYPAYSTAAAVPSSIPVSAASVFDPFGSVLEPSRPGQKQPPAGVAGAFAGGQQRPQPPQQARAGLTGDLDSSLAVLAGRLDVRDPSGPHGRHSMNWQPVAAASSPAQAAAAAAAAKDPGGGRAPGRSVPIAPGPTVNWGIGGAAQPAFAAMPSNGSGPSDPFGAL